MEQSQTRDADAGERRAAGAFAVPHLDRTRRRYGADATVRIQERPALKAAREVEADTCGAVSASEMIRLSWFNGWPVTSPTCTSLCPLDTRVPPTPRAFRQICDPERPLSGGANLGISAAHDCSAFFLLRNSLFTFLPAEAY